MKKALTVGLGILLCGVAGAQTFVSGTVSGTWDAAGSPYVVQSPGVIVPAAATLTIDPGVVVRFEAATSLTAIGNLVVNGTAGNEVSFEAAVQPATSGDWAGLVLESGSHQLAFARIRDAGVAIDNGLAGASDLAVTDCTFENDGTGVFHEGSGDLEIRRSTFLGPGPGVGLASSLDPDVIIQDNSFDGCIEAMIVGPSSSPDLGGNTATNCGLNGTRIVAGGPITGTALWDADSMPLVLRETVAVAPGGSLTIAAGAVIKSRDDFDPAMLEVSGNLEIQGTAGSPVVLTSLLDDSVLGDTNGDGAATVPTESDWSGVRIQAGSASLSNAELRYTGVGVDNGLSGASDLTVESSTFEHVGTGIFHQGPGTLHVTGSTFLGPGPGVGLAPILGPDVTVTDNHFDGCVEAMIAGPASSPTLGGNTAVNCGINGMRIFAGGPITGNATWDDDSMPIVLREPVVVAAGGALTVEAGTVVKSLDDFQTAMLDVSGTLDVQGTADKKVVFTSLRDDTVLGDTNGDGAATFPDQTDWGGIRGESGATALAHAELRHTGVAIDNGLGGPSSLTVDSCTFSDVATGIFHQDTGTLSVTRSRFLGPGPGIGLASGLGPSVVVQNNTFDGCIEAMLVAPDSNADLGGNTASDCGLNGTRILPAGPISGAAVWAGDSMPFVMRDTITVAAGGSLTVEAGAVIKSRDDLNLAELQISGTLTIDGTPERPAVFTSLLDDTVLGDTNGDGAATQPQSGDWSRIHIDGGTAAVTGARIAYGNAGIAGTDAVLLLDRSIFLSCFTGIEAFGATSGHLHDSIAAENSYGVATDGAASFTLGLTLDPDPSRRGKNDIYCNATADVIHTGPGTQEAQGNWWGEAPPNALEILTPGGGSVDVSDYLAGPTRDVIELRVSEPAPAVARLTWNDPITCNGYRVQRSPNPQFSVIDIDQSLPPGTQQFDVPGIPIVPVQYYRVLPE